VKQPDYSNPHLSSPNRADRCGSSATFQAAANSLENYLVLARAVTTPFITVMRQRIEANQYAISR